MPLFLIPLLTWLRRFAASIPAWAWALLAMAAVLAWEAHSAHHWRSRAKVAETSLASVRAAQLAANKAAVATKVRVETAQTNVTKESDHATIAALDSTRADYAALRLRYAALARHPGPGAVPGVPGGPGVADGPTCPDAAIPTPQLIDFAEQGDEFRAIAAGWQAWYAAQAAVERTPTP